MQPGSERIWVSKILASNRFGPVENRFIRSLLAFGWLPVVLTAGMFVTSNTGTTGSFLLAQGLATLLVIIVPYLIWHYDERVKSAFYDRVTRIVEDETHIEGLSAKYDAMFARRYWIITSLWTALALAVYVGSEGFLAAQGITGPASLAYWFYGGFFLWAGLLTGIGFHGILVTILCIRELADEVPVRIDPLEPDELGGLSAVGYFAIWTTILASVGSLLFPLAFEMAVHGGFEPLVYTAVGLYVLFMLLAFVYPTLKINSRAQDLRESKLEEIRTAISTLQSELAVHDGESRTDQEELARQLEIQRLRGEYDDYRNVRLYPMSTDILTRLAGSILLPLGFIFLELLLPKLVV